MISLFVVPALATTTKVVDITRPEGNEIVTKDIFSICGVCIYNDTTIEFEYKDKETGKYRPLINTEGDSVFKVGSNKMFAKDIQLKYEGENEIKVTSYTKATQENPQENYYTITLTYEKKKNNWLTDSITNITYSIKNWLDEIK